MDNQPPANCRGSRAVLQSKQGEDHSGRSKGGCPLETITPHLTKREKSYVKKLEWVGEVQTYHFPRVDSGARRNHP